MKALRRFLPRQIATQIILLVVLSAVIFHLCINAAFLIGRGSFHHDHPPGEGFPLRIVDFMQAASALPAHERQAMIAWLARAYPMLDIVTTLPPGYAAAPAEDDVIAPLRKNLGSAVQVDLLEATGLPRRIGFRFSDGFFVASAIPPDHPPPPEFGPQAPDPAGHLPPLAELRPPPHMRDMRAGPPDGPPHGPPPHGPPDGPPDGPPHGPHGPHGPPLFQLIFGTLLFIALSFTVFLIWAINGLTRPLRKFAAAVDALAIDGAAGPIEESGPKELCSAAHALNRMRERVTVMIAQRTQMLAAISHDLRTPVTRLRLRAEFVEPSDVRDAMLRDLEQMNAMIHSALSFIRDGIEVERTALLDLGALLQTIRDEFADMGHRVLFEKPAPTMIKGNADELYRALTNLVSNGVKYGTEVEIRLMRPSPDRIEIDIIDDGPGIPAEDKAAMFAPFVRGSGSRRLDGSQGFGLGLPISQAIIAAHKGSLELLDRPPHGVIARVTLAV